MPAEQQPSIAPLAYFPESAKGKRVSVLGVENILMGRNAIGEGGYAKNNIRMMRERLGWTQTELSEKSGVSKSQLSRLELSKRRMPLDIANQIAISMKCSVESLVGVQGDTIRVVVIANVQAGCWTEAVEWPPEDRYEVAVVDNGLYPGVERIACEVLGPSMNKVYPEGTVLIAVPFLSIKEPLIPGRRYILKRKRTDGMMEQTVKTYIRDRDGQDWFYPESDDPKFQEPISYDDGSGEIESVEVIARVIQSIRNE